MKRTCLRHSKYGWKPNPFMANRNHRQQYRPLPPGVHPQDRVEVSFSKDIPSTPINHSYEGLPADAWRWTCVDGNLNITYYRVTQKATNREI